MSFIGYKAHGEAVAQLSDILLYLLYIVCVCMCALAQITEVGIRFLGAGVTDGCELPNGVGFGNRTQSSA